MADRDGHLARFLERYGLAPVPLPPPTPGQRIHDFFENFLILLIVWAYNPGEKAPFFRCRTEVWAAPVTLASRRSLRARVISRPHPDAPREGVHQAPDTPPRAASASSRERT